MAVSTRGQAAVDLGRALQKARESRGVSGRALAKLIGRDSGLISRWENGERRCSPENLEAIIEALEIEGDEAGELLDLADVSSRQQAGQWLAVTLPERRAQMAALLAAERTATAVTHVAPLLIPGVLQTSDVIRTIMVEGGAPENEIDERVAMRIGRRELITRRRPAELDVLLGEAAIRHLIGGRQVMADQLRYLSEMTELPNVEIRIVPFAAGWNAGLSGAFIVFDSDSAPPMVNLELGQSGVILRDPSDIEAYRQAAAAAREKAMSVGASAELIADALTDLEKQK
ncbi:helix-turn-helix transcriptional regulator [Amycolatopsis sp. NPDC051372]|uniref:helix-turn-helix domain-containing protein n=1 Tax=Amycolatopsis sp. NPDC051372 TaxID=3155669 RepID=UPI0034466623